MKEVEKTISVYQRTLNVCDTHQDNNYTKLHYTEWNTSSLRASLLAPVKRTMMDPVQCATHLIKLPS